MRVVLASLLLLALAGSWWVRARAEDGDPLAAETLKRRLDRHELELKYLRSRDKALTAYVVANGERARALAQALRRARDEGFTAGAIPGPAREALLAGLEGAAAALQRDLPEITKEEISWLETADKLR